MIHNDSSHHIFRISALTRVIASQLLLVSQKSIVNLACVCRYLEEPALSTLWETQSSLDTLLKVLPEGNWYCNNPAPRESVFSIVGDPSPEAWKRVQRYASWMHRLWFRADGQPALAEGVLPKLRLNSPIGGWFPALQDLSWCITKSNLYSADLFLSQHLRNISISPSLPWLHSGIPHDALPVIASAIDNLPTSALRSLCISTTMPQAELKGPLSSVVLRCGPSLTMFISSVPLTDAAVHHLVQLPQLHTWYIDRPPPDYSTSSLPLAFPPLVDFTLGEGATRGWIFLFERLERGVSATQGVTPLSKVKESLQFLEIENLPDPTIDASFTSAIQMFRNLTSLNIQASCYAVGVEEQCTFKLTNDDVTKLAMTLSQLEVLTLGNPCFENTCATTVACLFLISVHCVRMRQLEIHFNTTNIVDDLKAVSADPRLKDLRSLPRCPLSHWSVWQTPLSVGGPDLETVVTGMVDIFPSLENCESATYNSDWNEFSEKITELRKTRTPPRVVGGLPRLDHPLVPNILAFLLLVFAFMPCMAILFNHVGSSV